MRVQINHDKCQGHGRCYDLAPDSFTEDDEGYGQVVADGLVSADQEGPARLAVSNCPERAIDILQEA